MIEVEIKLPIKDIGKIETNLTGMGFVRTNRIREKDFYFDNADKQIRLNGEALRVRQETDLYIGHSKTVITYKGKKLDHVSMTRKELETGVQDAQICIQILQAIGFDMVSPAVIKTRQMFCLDDITACLDSVEGLGDFLELEIIIPEDGRQDWALDRIETILGQLGYSLKDTTRTSYLSMLQRRSGEP